MEIIDTPTLPTYTNKAIDLLEGSAVFAALEDKHFCQEWRALYQSCPWATVFQSEEFVSTWYRLFKGSYTPLMVKMEQGEQLIGLLLLAITPDGGKSKPYIVGAGHGEADYQAWLSLEINSDGFIKEALNLLLKHHPDKYISLRHLTPNVPKMVFRVDEELGKKCVLQPFPRPVVNLDKYKISKRDRKRVNRLKKRGTFQRIEDYQELEAMIDDLGVMYDFRQAAMFNKFPFSGEPLNREFILRLFKEGILEVTVLKIKDDIVSAVASVQGKQRSILGGINLHHPAYASFSPGYVHFLLLFEILSAEDYKFFDLTPGSDGYKMRLASHVETVHEMTVTNSPLFRLNRKFRIKVYDYLVQKGKNPLMMKLAYSREKYMLKQKGLKKYLFDFLRKKTDKSQAEIFTIDLNRKSLVEKSIDVKVDNKKDLLNYTFTGKGFTRWEFLEESMRRLELGEKVFTWGDSDHLFAAIWCQDLESENTSQPDSLLYDVFFSEQEDKDIGVFMENVLLELKSQGYALAKVQLKKGDAMNTTIKKTLIK